MAELKDVMVYVCKNYPHKHELSKARLTKTIYLADWRAAITRGRQLTDILWEFSHYGPYVHDIENIARSDPDFTVEDTVNAMGSRKTLVSCRAEASYASVTDDDALILNKVIETTATKYWDDFIKLVYSTFPIVTQPRYAKLHLVELAREYQKAQNILEDA